MDELKLCFIWVDKFRNFKNAGINFSSDEKFSYNREYNHIEINEDFTPIPNKFYGTNITDVSGLIGKNGVGKSNALELVCKLIKGGKTSIGSDFFIIVKFLKEYLCYYSFKDKSKRIHYDFPLTIHPYDNQIDPLKIVFFSNVFDERIHNFNKEVSDISGNYRYPRSRFASRSRRLITDFEKQIQFIKTNLFLELGIEIPQKIQITSKIWSRSVLNSSTQKRIYGDFYEELTAFSKIFKSRLSNIKTNRRFYYVLVYSFFIETLRNLDRSRINTKESADYYLYEFISHSNLYKDEGTEEMVESLIKWMQYINESFHRFINVKYAEEHSLFNSQLEFLKELRNTVDDLKVDYDIEGRGIKSTEFYIFDYDRNLDSVIRKYIGLFESSSMYDINWLGISSGHKAYLNIFSLLHHELKRVRKENLLLCIDEGDLYLHPQWQIEFFDKLITVLPKIFKGSIQLILTSHSPFLLSDLPNQSITIIDPNQEGNTINGIDLKRQTFAGNIYNLYEEPFFLGENRLSQFARKKIERIIDELDGNSNSKFSDKSSILKQHISLIGDEVIRFHLNKRLNND